MNYREVNLMQGTCLILIGYSLPSHDLTSKVEFDFGSNLIGRSVPPAICSDWRNFPHQENNKIGANELQRG